MGGSPHSLTKRSKPGIQPPLGRPEGPGDGQLEDLIVRPAGLRKLLEASVGQLVRVHAEGLHISLGQRIRERVGVDRRGAGLGRQLPRAGPQPRLELPKGLGVTVCHRIPESSGPRTEKPVPGPAITGLAPIAPTVPTLPLGAHPLDRARNCLFRTCCSGADSTMPRRRPARSAGP